MMKQTQIAFHNTASTRSNSLQLNAVNNYHKEKWGMKSSLGWYVAYNFFLDSDGTVTQCRSLDEETIANKGHNCDVDERCDTISICAALNGDTQTLNVAQEKGWRDFYAQYPLKVTLHRDLQANRTCPGKLITTEYLYNLLEDNHDNKTEKAEGIEEQQKKLKIKLLNMIVKLQLKVIHLLKNKNRVS